VRDVWKGDVQQRDGACEHLAVPAVPSGDVLRGDGPDRADWHHRRGRIDGHRPNRPHG
jgi:hypothetical protein